MAADNFMSLDTLSISHFFIQKILATIGQTKEFLPVWFFYLFLSLTSCLIGPVEHGSMLFEMSCTVKTACMCLSYSLFWLLSWSTLRQGYFRCRGLVRGLSFIGFFRLVIITLYKICEVNMEIIIRLSFYDCSFLVIFSRQVIQLL